VCVFVCVCVCAWEGGVVGRKEAIPYPQQGLHTKKRQGQRRGDCNEVKITERRNERGKGGKRVQRV